LTVVGEQVHYILIDFGQGQHLHGAAVYCHVNHGNVAKNKEKKNIRDVGDTFQAEPSVSEI
jgi:hypothetical protein